MTLRYLEIFCMVCRENSMTKAAEKLHMAQPAVSRAGAGGFRAAGNRPGRPSGKPEAAGRLQHLLSTADQNARRNFPASFLDIPRRSGYTMENDWRNIPMPRPPKCRRICSLPDYTSFGPLEQTAEAKNFIEMTLDEYESIRLMDLEGCTQEECAARMNVARTTVQAVYTLARQKLADSLVNGRPLTIRGGHYQLCCHAKTCCGRTEKYPCRTRLREPLPEKNKS